MSHHAPHPSCSVVAASVKTCMTGVSGVKMFIQPPYSWMKRFYMSKSLFTSLVMLTCQCGLIPAIMQYSFLENGLPCGTALVTKFSLPANACTCFTLHLRNCNILSISCKIPSLLSCGMATAIRTVSRVSAKNSSLCVSHTNFSGARGSPTSSATCYTALHADIHTINCLCTHR